MTTVGELITISIFISDLVTADNVNGVRCMLN